MNDFFDMAALLSLMRTHYLITLMIITGLVSLIIAWRNWEQISYFLMRTWHGIPLIGTVARLAKGSHHIKDGWPSVEENLCRNYEKEYRKYEGGPALYLKSKDYLAKIGETGRDPMPAWVLGLAFALLVLEAVGFAFVLGPWINPNVSATQMGYLAWGVAFFLALISGFFAHFAGHNVHYNSIVKKAHAWWSQDTKNPNRPHALKELSSVPSIDDTYTDNDQPDYQQIMARITVNSSVSEKKGSIYSFVAIIIIFAFAAFWIRAETLKSIETDLVGMQEVTIDLPVFSSPFDLPEESAQVNTSVDNQRIEEKMAAVRNASLVTYIVLSVVYIAIQIVMFWLSIRYGFAGKESKKAWQNTYKFKTAEQYADWLASMRRKITSHADHKLRLLQQKRATIHTVSAAEQDALATDQVGARTFLAYIRMRDREVTNHQQDLASPTPSAVQVEHASSPGPHSVAASPELAAPASANLISGVSTDLTVLDELELEDVADNFEENLDTLKSIRRKQLAMKKLGQLPQKSPEVPV